MTSAEAFFAQRWLPSSSVSSREAKYSLPWRFVYARRLEERQQLLFSDFLAGEGARRPALEEDGMNRMVGFPVVDFRHEEYPCPSSESLGRLFDLQRRARFKETCSSGRCVCRGAGFAATL